jgi:hypothetical protein
MAGGFFLSVTRAGLARVVCFKNSCKGLSRIARARLAHVRNVPSSVPPNSTVRKSVGPWPPTSDAGKTRPHPKIMKN